jgi:hypothetical protein
MASAHIDITWPGIAGFDPPPSSSYTRMDRAMRARPSAASRDEDLWPVDEERAAIWEARRGRRRAVKRVGVACMVAIGALATWIAGSAPARAGMVAWGTMGPLPSARVVAPMAATPAPMAAVVEAPKRVEPVAAAPAARVVANAPALAPAPTAEPARTVKPAHVAKHAAGARIAARHTPRDLEDPYADAAPAQHDELANPY